MRRRSFLLATASLSLTAFTANTFAQAPTNQKLVTRDRRTVVYVDGIHCEFCAAKLTKKLQTLKGVKTIEVDVKKKMAVLIPKDPRKLPTPLAQWQAIEKAGYKPVKLIGPRGTWVSKPTTNTASTATTRRS